MAYTLEDSGPKPKSRAGRQAPPINEAFLKLLATELTKTPTVATPEGDRPRLLGPDSTFATKGKATAEGRRYQLALQKVHGVKAKISGLEVKSGSTSVWKWRVYLPLEVPSKTS